MRDTPIANLPPMTASPTSTMEINLRRLMSKCDAKVQSSDKILQGSDRTKYAMNINALKEMLADLENDLTKKGTLDKTIMKEYTDKVYSLASVVEESVPIPSTNKSLTQARVIAPVRVAPAFGDVSGAAALAGASTQMGSKEHTNQVQADLLRVGAESSLADRTDELLGLRERRPGRESHHNHNIGGRSQQNGLDGSLTRDSARDQRQIEAALQNDRAHREEMEAGLSMLMKQLRHNAMAIHQTLENEQKSGIMNDADQALDTNISRLEKERTRLELYSKRSRKTMWMIWGIVFGVSIVFVIMFFVIRIF